MIKRINFEKFILHSKRSLKNKEKDKVTSIISQNSGEGFVDTAIKILISVVIGALLLGGLYALFGDTIMPTVTSRIKEMFNYKG